MPRRTTDGRTLVIAAVRAGYGAALLLVPDRLVGPGAPGPAATVARVLGARHVLQSLVTVLAPTERVVAAGAVVDGVHGGTDVALAAVSRRWRRVALADAVIATVLAAAPWGGRGELR